MSNGEPDYLLSGGPAELERLQLQARVWEPEAERLFGLLPVKEGMSAVDIGCGAMGCLGALARQVGPSGSVIGTDTDARLLAAAQGYVEQERLSNVRFQLDDVFASTLPARSFDLVHSRFMFAPIGRHNDLLAGMLRLARIGGMLVTQEPESASWRCYPQAPAFDHLIDVVRRAFALAGGDFDVGRSLYSLFCSKGLRDIGVRGCLIALPPGHPYMRLPVQFAASLRARILDHRLLTERKLSDLIEQCEREVADPSRMAVTFTVIQVWGKVS